ncbi:MAG: SRPBCC family protein [Anaerolineales bacterium]|uniref:SRPBCC family protein n=1 Tax=Candidatus Desulfolinea nitratireducens TaxID=2841698 RepID=A0A8J6TIU4_9CHLR|nr:SRPBCC family protein [Candidatus Desulfolinea nitratireducens]
MKIESNICIDDTKEQIWKVITDIENSVNTIEAIEKIEILERPASGLLGLKWRETRIMFGKSATEVMWITDSAENEYYQTRAESHGAVYISRLQIETQGGETCLRMLFEGEPQGTFAKIMAAATSFIFKGATQKALDEDLRNIKASVENSD